MKRSLSLIFAFLAVTVVTAQNQMVDTVATLDIVPTIETVVTADGSKYPGFMAGQYPGGQIAVMLSEAVTRANDPDSLLLPGNEARVNVKDITEIVREPYPANRLNGLQDVVKLKNGVEVVGQTIKTVPGKEIAFRDAKGKNYTFKLKEIATQSRKAINDTIPFFEQTPLIETFVFDQDTVVGLMVRQDMSTGQIAILTLDGEKEVRNNRDVTSLERRVNPEFEQKIIEKKPVYRGMMANGVRLSKAKHSDAYQANKTVALVNPGSYTVVKLEGGKVTFTMPYEMSNYLLYPLDIKKYKGVVRDISVKYSDLMMKSSPRIGYKLLPEHMMSATYTAAPGLYMLFDSNSGAAYLLQLK